VTHDQEEALAMGDRVGVMSAGRLEQIAPPAELYDRPRTRFVAEFVGLTNRMDGTADGGVVHVLGSAVPLLEGSVQSGAVKALVRPENVRLTRSENGTARVAAVSFLGSLCRAQVTLPDDTLVVAQMSASEATDLGPGTTVDVGIIPAPVFAVAD
jgi:putative spermidine/putrescine transport system ATP-binding protein